MAVPPLEEYGDDEFFDMLSELSSEQFDNSASANKSSGSSSDDETLIASNIFDDQSDSYSNPSTSSFKKRSLDGSYHQADNRLPGLTHADPEIMSILTSGNLLGNNSGRKDPDHCIDVKRAKREERLAKNRESANKSRLKRKIEMEHMESLLQTLRNENSSLKQDNAALRAENSILSDQVQFLRGLWSERVNSLTCSKSDSQNMHGVAVLGIVCTFSIFGSTFLPSSLSGYIVGAGSGNGPGGGAISTRSGRVLMSFDSDSNMDYRLAYNGFNDWEQHIKPLLMILVTAIALLITIVLVSRLRKRN